MKNLDRENGGGGDPAQPSHLVKENWRPRQKVVIAWFEQENTVFGGGLKPSLYPQPFVQLFPESNFWEGL